MPDVTEAPLPPFDEEAAGSSATRTRRSKRARPPIVVVLAACVVAIASLAPVGYLVLREGFSLGALIEALDSPSTPELIRNTAVLLVAIAAICLVLGVGLAVLVTRTSLPAPRLWIVLFTMPLAVPGFVAAYTWVAASYRYIPSSTAIFGLGGSALVLSLGLFPYVFLPCVAALRSVDAAQEEVSRGLGHSSLRTFLTVTLPQLRIAIAGGMLIVVLHVLAEFGALQLLNYTTLTTAIMQRVLVLGSPETGRALAMVLVGGAALLLLLERIARGRRTPIRVGRGTARAAQRWRLTRAGTALWTAICTAIAALALGVPAYIAVVGLSDAIFGSAAARINWSAVATATTNTVQLSLAAGIVATVVALPISWLYARHPGPLATVVERSVWLAHALPGIVLALALVYIGVRAFTPLYQTPLMLVAAYVILFLPLAVANQHVGLQAASRRLDEAAHSLGYGRLRTFTRVTLPIALPGVASGALFVMLDSAKELTTTLLLVPTGMTTLSTGLWSTTNGEVLNFAAAAPYGIGLIAVGILPAYLLARRTVRIAV